MSEMTMPETRVLNLEDIKPYWNNPRRISEEAVQGLKTSMEEFGYQQPLVVDTDNVLVVGHTRRLAMIEMGVGAVEVYVSTLSEEKNREYRLVDNKTGEMSDWDHSLLVTELREFETGLLEQFFPDVDLEIQAVTAAQGDVTDEDVTDAVAQMNAVKEVPQMLTTRVECPACFHSFEVRTDSLPGLSQDDLSGMSERGRSE